MRFLKEYLSSLNQEEFKLKCKDYNASAATVQRTWYRLNNYLGPVILISEETEEEQTLFAENPPMPNNEFFLPNEKEPVGIMKMIMWKDMVRITPKRINRNYLGRYGFTNYEINWLIDSGYFKE